MFEKFPSLTRFSQDWTVTEKMRYTIELRYITGDTFSTYETTGSLEITWENLDVAQKALERIEKHDRAYKDAWHSFSTPEQRETFENVEGYCKEYSILLPMDDGSEQKVYIFWQGYFESLIGGEIIPANPLGRFERYH